MNISFVVAMCLLSLLNGQSKENDIIGFWLPIHINWTTEKILPDEDVSITYASTRVLFLDSTHVFKMLEWIPYKAQGDSITRGEAMITGGYVGRWEMQNSNVAIVEFVKTGYGILYGNDGSSEMADSIQIMRNGTSPILLFHGEQYIVADKLAYEVKELLHNIPVDTADGLRR